jgi:hypothetical protein
MKRETFSAVAVLLAGIAVTSWWIAYPEILPASRPALLDASPHSTTRDTPELPLSEPQKLSGSERTIDIDAAEDSGIASPAVTEGITPERGSARLAADAFSALREVTAGETVRFRLRWDHGRGGRTSTRPTLADGRE